VDKANPVCRIDPKKNSPPLGTTEDNIFQALERLDHFG
jgi:hypothetical protein